MIGLGDVDMALTIQQLQANLDAVNQALGNPIAGRHVTAVFHSSSHVYDASGSKNGNAPPATLRVHV